MTGETSKDIWTIEISSVEDDRETGLSKDESGGSRVPPISVLIRRSFINIPRACEPPEHIEIYLSPRPRHPRIIHSGDGRSAPLAASSVRFGLVACRGPQVRPPPHRHPDRRLPTGWVNRGGRFAPASRALDFSLVFWSSTGGGCCCWWWVFFGQGSWAYTTANPCRTDREADFNLMANVAPSKHRKLRQTEVEIKKNEFVVWSVINSTRFFIKAIRLCRRNIDFDIRVLTRTAPKILSEAIAAAAGRLSERFLRHHRTGEQEVELYNGPLQSRTSLSAAARLGADMGSVQPISNRGWAYRINYIIVDPSRSRVCPHGVVDKIWHATHHPHTSTNYKNCIHDRYVCLHDSAGDSPVKGRKN
ncbi:hypothetical protein GEV33_014327 [Tenebrio molitor]|uniref:Uncharacterized protein n=1 Tax=Tenebrio molitor TaxID=7067 RepID=A0A8J6L1W2_TENMO|nr:hypothetical protein GEV33_014327 [Tenebrio molitor]